MRMPGARPAPLAPHRIVVALGLLTALGPLTVDLYVPALPELGSEFDATASAVQATLAGSTVGLAVGTLLVGPWSDRAGRRLPLLTSTAVHIAASVLCALAPSIETLIGMRVLSGAAAAGGGVVAAAMVRDMYRGLPMMRLTARLALISGAAPIVAPLLGALLMVWFDWRGIFWWLAAFAIIALAAAAVVVPETLARPDRHAGWRATFLAFGAVVRDRRFRLLMLLGAALWSAQFAFIAGSPFLFQERFGFTSGQFGLLYAVTAAGFVGGAQLAPRLASRIGAERVLLAGCWVMAAAGLASTATIAVGVLPLMLVSLWVGVAAVGTAIPSARALAMNRIDRHAGTAAALLGACNFATAGLVAPLAGVAIGPVGVSMGIVIFVCAAIAAALATRLTAEDDSAWDLSAENA
jgi:DHA1 family bicyclomycin/chloramphenicol resistance-like MFS transporter